MSRAKSREMLDAGHPTTRLEALTDGVFAIVMTILVFDLRLTDEVVDLETVLAKIAPSLAAFLFSFVQLGVYWVGHRAQCAFITHEDHRLRWIVLAFLAAVALVPFTTQVLARYPWDPVAESLYVANLVVVGLLLGWHWRHATHARRLVTPDLPTALVRVGFERALFAPVVYAVALAFSLTTGRSILAFAIIAPLPYLVPRVMDAILAAIERAIARLGGTP